MKTRLKQWFTSVPGIILITAGTTFMILDVLNKVKFDTWHIVTFMGVGMFLLFGHSTDFKKFGELVSKIITKKK